MADKRISEFSEVTSVGSNDVFLVGSTNATNKIKASNLLNGIPGALSIAHGGTGQTTAKDALYALTFLGRNITGGTENDTREWWVAKGTGFAFFNQTGQLNGQPAQNGFLINLVHNFDVHQEFWIQNNGAHYHRGANSETTAMPSWTPNDTTYSSLAAASGGTDVSLVTTGEKYKWNNKADRQTSTTLIPQANIRANEDLNDYVQIGTYAVGLSSTAETIKNSPTNYAFRLNVYSLNSMIIDTQGTWLYRMQEVIEFSTFKAWHRYAHTEGDAVWQYGVWTPNDTTYSNATTSAAGLMSAADKAKLDNMQSQIDQWKSYTQALRDAMQGYIDNLPDAPGELVTP